MPMSTIFTACNVLWSGPARADGPDPPGGRAHDDGYSNGSATVDLISSIDSSAVTLWTFTSEISA